MPANPLASPIVEPLRFRRHDLFPALRSLGKARGRVFNKLDALDRNSRPSSYVEIVAACGEDSVEIHFHPYIDDRGRLHGRSGKVTASLAEVSLIDVVIPVHGWRFRELVRLAKGEHLIEVGLEDDREGVTLVVTCGGRAHYRLLDSRDTQRERDPLEPKK